MPDECMVRISRDECIYVLVKGPPLAEPNPLNFDVGICANCTFFSVCATATALYAWADKADEILTNRE